MNTPNFAAELEVMANHLEVGDEVKILHCTGELLSCLTNPKHWESVCFRCKSMFQDGMQKLGVPDSALISLPRNLNLSYDHLPEKFYTIEQLRMFQIDGIDVGASVLSSLISEVKNHKLSPLEYEKEISIRLKTAYYVYQAFQKVLDSFQPELVYLFNGRLAESRVVLRLCQQRKIPVYTIERAGEFGKYNLFENTLPHDLDYNKTQMECLWAEADPQARTQKGSQWFEDRRRGKDQGKRSFIKDQQRNSLPAEFNPECRNIVIYNSSEYEYATIKGWKIPFYEDQNDAILKILNTLNKEHADENIHLWVRVHPNLKRGNNIQIQELREMAELELPNLHIIPPESPLDSYALMDACEKVVSFSSTMGVEAGYWQTPSILIGHAFYEDLGCCYRPQSHEEVIQLILEKNLAPKPREGSLKYGHYMISNGYPFKRFQQTGFHDGTFSGKRLVSGDSRLLGRLYFKTLRRLDKLKDRLTAR